MTVSIFSPVSLAVIQHTCSLKMALAKHNGDIMKEEKRNCRINAKISKENYANIDELMKNEQLISMKLSKGAILDIALSTLFNAIAVGESLESLAIQHLERIADVDIDAGE